MKRKGFKYTKGAAMPCPKCGHDTAETKSLCMSSKFSAYPVLSVRAKYSICGVYDYFLHTVICLLIISQAISYNYTFGYIM